MKILEEELKERYASKSYIAPGWWVIEDTNFTLLLQAQAELTRDEIRDDYGKNQFNSSYPYGWYSYPPMATGANCNLFVSVLQPDSGPIEYPYTEPELLHRKFLFEKDGQEVPMVVDDGNTVENCAKCMGYMQRLGYKQIG
jgi:hypothetical protein